MLPAQVLDQLGDSDAVMVQPRFELSICALNSEHPPWFRSYPCETYLRPPPWEMHNPPVRWTTEGSSSGKARVVYDWTFVPLTLPRRSTRVVEKLSVRIN